MFVSGLCHVCVIVSNSNSAGCQLQVFTVLDEDKDDDGDDIDESDCYYMACNMQKGTFGHLHILLSQISLHSLPRPI